MKPLQWDLMSVAWRYAALRQFDFDDQPGSRAEWVETPWEHLPAEIQITLAQMRNSR